MMFYIIRIFYSFIIIFILYTFLIIYQKYSNALFKKNMKFISTDNNTLYTNPEKKQINIELVVTIPSHLIINTNNKTYSIRNILTNHELSEIQFDKLSEKIIKIYLCNKQLYENIFFDKKNNRIKNIDDFYIFHKKYLQKDRNYNILLKLYNNDNDYMYIFIDNYKMIKIVKYIEYNNICNIIENKGGIFLIKDHNKYYITHGGYVKENNDLSHEQIINIFFNNNVNENDKNYKILNNFHKIKIYYFICTLID